MSLLSVHSPPDAALDLSLGAFGERKLSLLCRGLGLPRSRHKEALRNFRLMSRSWADLPRSAGPAWPTDITDDGTPYEFSVAFDGRAPKFRLLVESQEPPMTLQSSWDAGLRLNERLGDQTSVCLERFETVRDLFAPTRDAAARYCLWHAAVLEEGAAPAYKIYLNPQIHGSQEAVSVATKALERLGIDQASTFLRARPGLYGPDQLLYFSLDLSSARDSRVKLYAAHPGADAQDIERALVNTSNFVPGEATRWIRGLLGTSGPFSARPILTCLAFTSAGELPVATMHLPIRSYTRDDERGVDLLRGHLTESDWGAFRSALALVADRPLSVGRGLLTYVSLRPSKSGLSVTTYIAPEAFAVIPPRHSWPPALP